MPPGNPITAISVTTRSTALSDVSGKLHFLTILDFPLAACCMATIDALGAGHQIHRPAHARDHLARDRPVGELALRIDLEPAQHRHVDMAAADQAERHRAVEDSMRREAR